MKKLSKETGLVSVFVLIFLSVYQPFGIQVSGWEHLVYLLGFGCTTWLSLSLTSLGLNFWQKKHTHLSFHFPTNVFWGAFQITLISVMNWLYHCYLQNLVNTSISWLQFLLYTWGVGVFPFVYFLWQNKNSVQIQPDSELSPDQALTPDSKQEVPVLIQIGQGSDQLILPLKSLVWVRAEGNYVQVYFLQDENIQQKLIRSTIVQIENDQENSSAKLFRCHRSILINLDHFSKVIRDSGAYLVCSPWCPQGLPVSRNYIKELMSFIPK